uniref:Vesicle-fusing ATPase n=1 Tax=Panagrellus redivivus TaxID=6233 RepID=A0A7E4VFQ2_PANRE
MIVVDDHSRPFCNDVVNKVIKDACMSEQIGLSRFVDNVVPLSASTDPEKGCKDRKAEDSRVESHIKLLVFNRAQKFDQTIRPDGPGLLEQEIHYKSQPQRDTEQQQGQVLSDSTSEGGPFRLLRNSAPLQQPSDICEPCRLSIVSPPTQGLVFLHPSAVKEPSDR